MAGTANTEGSRASSRDGAGTDGGAGAAVGPAAAANTVVPGDDAERRHAVGEIMARLRGDRAPVGGTFHRTPAELARIAPVVAVAPGLTVVTAAREARALLADPRLLVGSDEPAVPAVRVSPVGEIDALYHAMFSLQDGASHARLRQVVAPYFSLGAAQATEPAITALVERTWDEAVSAGSGSVSAAGATESGSEGASGPVAAEHEPAPAGFDLVAAFADPLPIRLARTTMGLPVEDEPQLMSWARLLRDQLSPQQTGGVAPDVERAAVAGTARLRGYAERAIAEAADGPLHAIAAASRAGNIRPHEAVGLFVLLLVNGLETLSQALVQAVRVVAADPAWLAAVRARPATALDAFRAALRTEPPLRMLARRAGCPVTIGGSRLALGGTAVVLLAAAVAEDAERAPGPPGAPGPRARQDGALAYGHGKHVCLGRHHADLVGAAVLRHLAARCARVDLLPGARPHRHVPVNGYAYLPVRPVPHAADPFTRERSA
ncbi:cytochrome P450 [Actinacidiphila guanduensis]|uniref:Cytochrome P450 n=1 Tax=Actinacidiphila guanduensis TaxID=310781 RepID=A0A1H0MCP1_9ACTN|nr:cytochrome P450 [Actinacidiphila guanduensis]SDO78189.1 Cytochrome P450 [Actinacidiphila guanduensis]